MFGFGNKMNKIARAVKKNNIKVLAELVGSDDKEIKLAAIDGLGELHSGDAIQPLIPLLRSEDKELRTRAAVAMGNNGNVHGKALLVMALDRETDADVKAALLEAMSKIQNY